LIFLRASAAAKLFEQDTPARVSRHRRHIFRAHSWNVKLCKGNAQRCSRAVRKPLSRFDEFPRRILGQYGFRVPSRPKHVTTPRAAVPRCCCRPRLTVWNVSRRFDSASTARAAHSNADKSLLQHAHQRCARGGNIHGNGISRRRLNIGRIASPHTRRRDLGVSKGDVPSRCCQ